MASSNNNNNGIPPPDPNEYRQWLGCTYYHLSSLLNQSYNSSMAATSAPSTGTNPAAPTTSTNRVPPTTGAIGASVSTSTATATAAGAGAHSTTGTSTAADSTTTAAVTTLSSADLKKYTWPNGALSFTYPGADLYSPNSKKPYCGWALCHLATKKETTVTRRYFYCPWCSQVPSL